MPQINVDIAADGSLRIDAVGFAGTDCEKATRFLEDALGRVRQRGRKPEYYARRSANLRQSVGGGR
jgi:hypothetical protein